jgi:ABC-type branched-subunit amino acid transport system ATPase component
MLEIKKLHKNFDGTKAVHDFSLQLKEGKLTSLIGPNGAGKTTLFNLITGYLKPDDGIIKFGKINLVGKPTWKINRFGISRTFQNLRLFKKLTALENVMLGIPNQKGESLLQAIFLNSNNSSEYKNNIKKAEEILEFVSLSGKRNEIADNLSFGQQKLLSLACCLIGESKLLLLDEPVSGVQPAMINKISVILKEIVHQKNKTILLIEHDMNFVKNISDEVIIMDHGKNIATGTPNEIMNDTEILESYLE